MQGLKKHPLSALAMVSVDKYSGRFQAFDLVRYPKKGPQRPPHPFGFFDPAIILLLNIEKIMPKFMERIFKVF